MLPRRAGRYALLAACMLYYLSWVPAALPVLLAVTGVSYFGGLALQKRQETQKSTRTLFVFFLLFTLSFLLVCKYTAFFARCVQHVLQFAGSKDTIAIPSMLLPVGISFFTLQAVSYLADVRSGKLPAETNFITYLLFMSFFPSVTSGPISRAPDLLPQLREKQTAHYSAVKHGLVRILWGLFLKLVIADRISPWVGLIYGKPGTYAGWPMWSAVLLYGFEIYTDFAGYTHIACGAAMLFGIRLPENFDLPYLSRSVREFWRRWHMSFSFWLRDYVYIPLGGSRCSKKRKYANVMATFAVSGLWHGAGLNYLTWGLLHGAYQVAGGVLAPVRKKACQKLHLKENNALRVVFSTVFTFALVDFAWIFFRCDTLAGAGAVIAALGGKSSLHFFQLLHDSFTNGAPGFWLVVGCIALLTVLACVQYRCGSLYKKWLALKAPVQWATLLLLFLVVSICGVYGPAYSAQSFIYAMF